MLFGTIVLLASMLTDADAIGKKYGSEIAKQPPPALISQANSLLNTTSSWLILDLDTFEPKSGQNVLDSLSNASLWQAFQNIGFDGLYVKNLKEGGRARTGFQIDPKWSKAVSSWQMISRQAQASNVSLVGDLIGAASGAGVDFEQALRNHAAYAGLYRLIEIDQKDWALLPKIPVGEKNANVPWLNLEELYKKGYIPEAARPYTKESDWNATAMIPGVDGMERRWIYLKENQNLPLLSWLSSSFAADRIASADALDWIYRLQTKILHLDAKLPQYAKQTAALWTRKIGGYTIASTNGTLAELQSNPADLAIDMPTKPALLHALLTEDAEVLRLIYNLYLEGNIALMGLVHSLEPFDASLCDWTEFLFNPKKKYLYREEKITGELLREKLLKEDFFRLRGESKEGLALSNWGSYCTLKTSTTSLQELDQKREEIQKAHLLLAFTYAMQPGVFALSASDLIGNLQTTSFSLFNPNSNAIYPSLPCQMQSPRSFASRLKQILSVRENSNIALGELIAVPPVDQKGTLLLLHRLPKSRFFHLLALNFSQSPVQEKLTFDGIRDTWAIDLMTGLAQEKGFGAGVFFFDLPPLSGKVFLFQPKYYD